MHRDWLDYRDKVAAALERFQVRPACCESKFHFFSCITYLVLFYVPLTLDAACSLSCCYPGLPLVKLACSNTKGECWVAAG